MCVPRRISVQRSRRFRHMTSPPRHTSRTSPSSCCSCTSSRPAGALFGAGAVRASTHAVTSRCRQRQPSASLRELPQPRCSPASPVSLHRFASPLRILHPRTPPPQRRPPPPETTFPPDRCSVVRWAQVRCMCRSARSGTPRRGSTSSSSSAGAPGSGCSSLPPPSPH